MIEDEKIIEMFFERSEQGIRELDFAYGYTYLEIARMEGSNKSTVMRSAKTALKKIQEKLAA